MIRRNFGIDLPREIVEKQISRLVTPEDFGGNIGEYAKRIVWFGRKSGATFKDNRKILEDSVDSNNTNNQAGSGPVERPRSTLLPIISS